MVRCFGKSAVYEPNQGLPPSKMTELAASSVDRGLRQKKMLTTVVLQGKFVLHSA